MRLKILVVPFAILMSLILVIGYVKPDIVVVQDKRILLETKTVQSQNIETLLSNIDTLNAALDNQSEAEQSVGLFLPKTIDQERAIDMFNYLAAQSGVAVSVMDIQEVEIKDTSADDAQALLATGGEGVLSNEAPTFKPKPKAYTAAVRFKGNYENIRDFFNRLTHVNRFHKILNFDLGMIEVVDTEATGLLSGTFESQFDYFPEQQLSSAVGIPVFMKGEFDAAQLATLRDWVRYTVPPLTKPVGGRPNPFQP